MMDEIVREFLVESNEGLDRLDQDFVELEKNPDDQALLANIFRCIHTIKGTCGFLGFEKLESVTHVGENLLSRLRDGELRLTPDSTSALLAMVDAVREIMGSIEENESEGEGDYTALVQRLQELTRPSPEPAAEPEPEPEPEPKAKEAAPAPIDPREADLPAFTPIPAKKKAGSKPKVVAAPPPRVAAAPSPAPSEPEAAASDPAPQPAAAPPPRARGEGGGGRSDRRGRRRGRRETPDDGQRVFDSRGRRPARQADEPRR
jgi:two-component system chemotaxis sensor kinase CheA